MLSSRYALNGDNCTGKPRTQSLYICNAIHTLIPKLKIFYKQKGENLFKKKNMLVLSPMLAYVLNTILSNLKLLLTSHMLGTLRSQYFLSVVGSGKSL